jgi:cytochrome c-type biogenesis protein CcmH
MAKRWSALLFCAALGVAQAGETDVVLDQRLNHVAEQLRCLVCQNQSIADSHAQLALDLKREARQQLAQGRSEQEVIDFMVQRYGDFVLYRPPFKAVTWALWLGPFLLLAIGLAALLYNVRRWDQHAEALEDRA